MKSVMPAKAGIHLVPKLRLGTQFAQALLPYRHQAQNAGVKRVVKCEAELRLEYAPKRSLGAR
jgi:hypothetical protein